MHLYYTYKCSNDFHTIRSHLRRIWLTKPTGQQLYYDDIFTQNPRIHLSGGLFFNPQVLYVMNLLGLLFRKS